MIRSKGDDLLCTFPHGGEAFEAATQMVTRDFGDKIKIHAGIHFGPIIEARGDIFGDTVNVAARMLALANPGEIVVTQDLREQLNPLGKRALRLLEQRAVKGKAQPIKIYNASEIEGEETKFYIESRARHTIRSESVELGYDKGFQIELNYQGRTLFCREGEGEITMGRSADCDLVVNEPCVSREHATVWVRLGKAVLIDRSSTGTYITANDESPVAVKRETVPLLGSGTLSLGRSPAEHHPHLIQYRQHTTTNFYD